MYRITGTAGKSPWSFALGLAMLIAPGSVHAQNFTVLYSFQISGAGGYQPAATMISDKAGNLYGTTALGGSGYGTVFKLAPDGTETVLYAFKGGSDGFAPAASLLMDAAGNLYGTTQEGGGTGCTNNLGCGTVFKLAPDGTETMLHAFTGGSDGAYPVGSLIADKAGNLYGTALDGGMSGCNGNGCGVAFRISPAGTETVLHTFGMKANDGVNPAAGLITDKKGNLYGTTSGGGDRCSPDGCGTVFELTKKGKENVLYSFADGNDGAIPAAPLVFDKQGNLYGTAEFGGDTGCALGGGCGTVFKLAPDGALTVVHAFNGSDGDQPQAGLTIDKAGNLYGTTYYGGGTGCSGSGCGTVFEVTPAGVETVLYAFTDMSDGGAPRGGLLLSGKSILYGTAAFGGSGSGGVVFKLTN
jgi:uncharacterized repeat protein (TIGR03803 family)